MTEKLYYKNAYIKEFSADIINCYSYNDGYAVILNKSAFFPCGGGQYGDMGEINGVEVIDTVEVDKNILHLTKEPILPRKNVNCRINWKIRYNRMQNHSGEHILSGLIFSDFGYNNVGFHLSDNDVTLDCDGKLSEIDIAFLERKANAVIYQNRDIKTYFPSESELSELEYRSKLDLTENVRIVEIDGVDKCACCAPHLNSTSEIGIIKIIRHYNYKGGTRFHIKCGGMAYEDYTMINNQITEIANASSIKRDEVLSVYNKMNSEILSLKNTVRLLREKEIERESDTPEIFNDIIIHNVQSYSNNEMTSLLNKSLSKHKLTSCVFSKSDDGYSFIIGGKKSKAVFDLLKTLDAKGGGREFIQGKIDCDISKISEILKYKKDC